MMGTSRPVKLLKLDEFEALPLRLNRMKVPLLNLQAQYESIRAPVLAAVERIMESQQFILGKEVRALEESVAHYSGTKHAVGCASGSDALLLSLMALDISAGDEVITTPFTFFATASAIARLGARPVFVDIDARTYNINPEAVQAAVTPRTRAIIPVHMYGQCAEMDPLIAIADRHGLAIIEDAAQAIGAEDGGRRAGSMGLLGCFSFYPTKNLGGAGDGGMLTTNDDYLANRLRRLRVHGGETEYQHIDLGINSRLDALQAAVLRVKFNSLEKWTLQRGENATRYDQLLQEADLGSRIIPPLIKPNNRHIFHHYVIRVPESRDALIDHLTKAEIGTKVYYPVPLHLQPCFSSLGYLEGDFPEAERAARETVAIPVYPELTRAQQAYVVEAIKSFFSRGSS